MFSPIYSAGGVYVPHPMFMPLQGGAGTSRGLPFFPPIGPHAFPYAPYLQPGQVPRMMNNLSGNAQQLSGEGPPQLRKLFIGGLSHETTDEQLRQFYAQWGTVVDCIVIRDPQTKYSRGFGFVTFATMQMAEAAMSDRPHTINNKVVDPKRAIPREQMSPLLPNHPPPFLEGEPDPGCKLSLSGIHWDFHTVDELRHYFDTFGVVEQVEILGNPRGFGFVVFEEKTAADRCVAHGKTHIINGRKCEVTQNSVTATQQQQMASGGGGGLGIGTYQRSVSNAKGSDSLSNQDQLLATSNIVGGDQDDDEDDNVENETSNKSDAALKKTSPLATAVSSSFLTIDGHSSSLSSLSLSSQAELAPQQSQNTVADAVAGDGSGQEDATKSTLSSSQTKRTPSFAQMVNNCGAGAGGMGAGKSKGSNSTSKKSNQTVSPPRSSSNTANVPSSSSNPAPSSSHSAAQTTSYSSTVPSQRRHSKSSSMGRRTAVSTAGNSMVRNGNDISNNNMNMNFNDSKQQSNKKDNILSTSSVTATTSRQDKKKAPRKANSNNSKSQQI